MLTRIKRTLATQKNATRSMIVRVAELTTQLHIELPDGEEIILKLLDVEKPHLEQLGIIRVQVYLPSRSEIRTEPLTPLRNYSVREFELSGPYERG